MKKHIKILHSEEHLVSSEKKYRLLIETMVDGLGISDLNENLIFVNRAFCELLGYKRDELIGKNILELIPDSYKDEIKRQTEIRKKGIKSVYETFLKTKTGQLRSFLISASPYYDIEGKITGAIAVLHDITSRKMAEEEINRAHQETEILLSSISSILIGIDKHDKITRWNSAAEKILGIPASKVIGKSILTCGINWDFPKILQQIGRCGEQNDQIYWTDIKYINGQGKEGYLDVTVNSLKTNCGKNAGFVFLISEVTEKRMLEMQLRQSQKLESIGQLAAGIAHEINTPTQFIGDNLHFLQESFKDINKLLQRLVEVDQITSNTTNTEMELQKLVEIKNEIDVEYLLEEIPAALSQSIEGVERVSNIVKAMKEFSHPGTEEKTSTDINKALENTILVSRNEWKYSSDVKTDFDPTIPHVLCFQGELNQVFLNMIINGVHAINDSKDKNENQKGIITIKTKKLKDFVEISIGDNGTGIPEEIQSKIFDPFFTTKDVGKGTGQGLAISYNVIVNKHGGEIKFDSKINQGTTFFIKLPISG
jgi:PAS domain S-box-containing protein